MEKTRLNTKIVVVFLITLSLLFQSFLTIPVFSSANTQLVPTITNITYTSISLSWATTSTSSGIKRYQLYRDGKEILSTTKTSCINTNLIPGRRYSYLLKAYDASGNILGESNPLYASTISDIKIPSAPETLQVFSKSYTSIALTWKPSTDNVKIKGYELYNGDKKIASTTDTYYVCKGLIPGKNYVFFIKALDVAGNYSLQNIISTSTVSDNLAPTVPNSIQASSITGTEINLTWSPSIDNVKVKRYEVFCDDSNVRSTSKTSYCSKDLIPGKSYTFTIRAIDSVGNISALSSPLKISSLKDIAAPSVPRNLKATAVSASSVSLTWDASLDNIKLKGYEVFCNGFRIATTTKTHYKVKNPDGIGFDFYYIKAFDLVDNFSENSNNTSVTTYN